MFYMAKDRKVADDMLAFFETLAPGKIKEEMDERERLSKLSDEEYNNELKGQHEL